MVIYLLDDWELEAKILSPEDFRTNQQQKLCLAIKLLNFLDRVSFREILSTEGDLFSENRETH